MEAKVGVIILSALLMSVGVVANEQPRPKPLFPVVYVDDGTRGCDGFPVCVQSIQDAIANWVDDGGTVIVLGSTQPYSEPVNVFRSARVIGENRANVTVDGGGTAYVFQVVAASVLLRNLTIVNAQVGVSVSANALTLDNVLITATPMGIVTASPTVGTSVRNSEIVNADGFAVQAVQADAMTFDNVTIRGGGWGIAMANSRDLVVTNNTIDGAGAPAVALQGMSRPRIENTSVVNGQDRGILVNGSTAVTIRGTTIRDNALTGLNISESVDVSVVDNVISGNGALGIPPRGPGPSPHPWQTGGGGLRFWQTDPVVVANNTIAGNEFFGVAIGGDRSTDFFLARNRVSSNNGTGLAVTEGAARFDIAGNFEANSGDGVLVDNATDVEVHNATLAQNGLWGLSGQFSVNVRLTNVTAAANGLLGVPRGPGPVPRQGSGGGLRFWQTDPSEIAGSVVIGNVGPGIALIDTLDFDITDNRIEGNTEQGVLLVGVRSSRVERNLVNGSAVAMELDGAVATGEGNVLDGTTAAVWVRGGSTWSATNDTANATGDAYRLEGASRATLLNGTFLGGGLTVLDGASNLTLRWFLDVLVLDADGNPAENATVRVFDLGGAEVFNGTANRNGTARWIVLTMYDRTGTDTYMHTPHEASAYLIGPDENRTSVTMNRSKSITIRLYRDADAPVIANVGANPDPQEQFLAVNVSATITDATAVTAFLNVTFPDGSWRNESMAPGGADGYFVDRTYDQVGLHPFQIAARDAFGNIAIAPGAFTILSPNAPPTITNAAATPDPQEVGGAVNVTATITDADGLVSVVLEVTFPDSTIATYTMLPWPGNVWYYEQAYVQLGVHQFAITATDAHPFFPRSAQAGNPFTIRDTTPPFANAGLDQIVPQGTTVQFLGNGSRDNDRIVNYTWTFDDAGPRVLYGDSPTYLFSRIGVFVVTLTVRDFSGNPGADAMTVTVRDVTAPQITGFAVDPSPFEVPGPANVSFAVVEANTVAVARIVAYDPGGGLIGNVTAQYDPGTGRYFYVWTFSVLGTHSFLAYAEDQSGNSDWDQVTALGEDSTPPVVSAVGALPSTQEVLLPVILWAQASDAFLAGVQVEVRDPAGPVVANLTMAFNGSAGRWEAAYVPSALGTHPFTAWAFDASGNASGLGGTFLVVDTGNPQLSGLAVTPQPQDVGGTVDVSVLATDNSTVSRVWIDLTDPFGVPVGAFDMTFSATDGKYHDVRPYPALGTYDFTIRAQDSAGNVASIPGQVVTVDRQAPIASGLTKDPTTWEAGGMIEVSATVTDNVAVDRVSLQVIDPTAIEAGNHTMTCTASVCAFSRAYALAGTYQLRVWATDASGNVGVAADTLAMIPGQAPVARAGPNVTIDPGEIVFFDGSNSTDDFGIVAYRWTFTYDGQPVTLTGVNASFRFDIAGAYTVTLSVEDIGGKPGTDTLTVTVRGPTPEGGGLSPLVLGGIAFLLLLIVLAAVWALHRRRVAKATARTEEESGPRSRDEERRDSEADEEREEEEL